MFAVLRALYKYEKAAYEWEREQYYAQKEAQKEKITAVRMVAPLLNDSINEIRDLQRQLTEAMRVPKKYL